MTGTTTHESDLSLGHNLADAASGIALSFFRREFRRWSKDDGSLATEVDLAIEDELRSRLATARPGDAMLGEERGQTGESSRRWIVDGIDGTADFAAGTLDWGTLIALEVDGDVVVGVCDLPAHGRRYWAVRGGGAFRADGSIETGRRIGVSAGRDLRMARSYVPPEEWLPDARARAIASSLASATKPEPQQDHPALQVAAGSYELAVFLSAGPWDLAAPALIVQEAGGRFTDISGRLDLNSGTAIFSNGHLHDELLRIVAGM